jgi:hypothetical protein
VNPTKMNEQTYYDALKTIAKDYMTVAEMRKKASREYGLTFEEVLEMAYENLQLVAADAIKGKRRPKS